MTFYENSFLETILRFLGIGESAFGYTNDEWTHGVYIDTKPLYAVAAIGALMIGLMVFRK